MQKLLASVIYIYISIFYIFIFIICVCVSAIVFGQTKKKKLTNLRIMAREQRNVCDTCVWLALYNWITSHFGCDMNFFFPFRGGCWLEARTRGRLTPTIQPHPNPVNEKSFIACRSLALPILYATAGKTKASRLPQTILSSLPPPFYTHTHTHYIGYAVQHTHPVSHTKLLIYFDLSNKNKK